MKEKTAPVSVITPAYNAENYISEAIESTLCQSFKDFEYILIDDASKDSTWEIIQKYAKKDKRIRAFRNERNLGIVGNRNKGVSLSRGEYILWQDNDDISLPKRIEKQYSFMEEHPEVGILGGYIRFFNEKGYFGVRKYPADDETLRKIMFRFSPIAQPAAMIRKKYLERAGQYQPSAIEDLDMTFRLAAICKMANLEERVIDYREREGSHTFTKLKKMGLDTFLLRKKYAKGFGYKVSLFDRAYNFCWFLSLYLMPSKVSLWFFNRFRNSSE